MTRATGLTILYRITFEQNPSGRKEQVHPKIVCLRKRKQEMHRPRGWKLLCRSKKQPAGQRVWSSGERAGETSKGCMGCR